jgi:hypothetical protein
MAQTTLKSDYSEASIHESNPRRSEKAEVEGSDLSRSNAEVGDRTLDRTK